MKKYDPLWQDLNNLLALLESYGTVEKLVQEYFVNRNNNEPPMTILELVKDYFAKFNNDAPPKLLRMYMDKLQKRLNEAESLS